jgi:glutamate dehydrogenase
VDLLYNGGIGTYVKASSSESSGGQRPRQRHSAGRCQPAQGAGDRRRRQPRLTQKGRIEFALNGGRIFTDAIDNSAGVDCSDHEVNIKILLAGLVGRGDMTGKQRDALLASMTDEVGRLVLADNYQQTQAIALEAARGAG